MKIRLVEIFPEEHTDQTDLIEFLTEVILYANISGHPVAYTLNGQASVIFPYDDPEDAANRWLNVKTTMYVRNPDGTWEMTYKFHETPPDWVPVLEDKIPASIRWLSEIPDVLLRTDKSE